jgi:hypothetical protein
MKPGFWTVDGYRPSDTKEYKWEPNRNSWTYGKGLDGAAGSTGLLQIAKGARLLYTPVLKNYKDMSVTMTLAPCKSAGQGFGSATGQYLEIYIKYDTQTQTGYGLRIIRTTKYDHAVDFILMKYVHGESEEISRPVSASCYKSNCFITLRVNGDLLSAHVETDAARESSVQSDLPKIVDLQEKIAINPFGGTGVQHTGSAGANATLLKYVEVKWDE